MPNNWWSFFGLILETLFLLSLITCHSGPDGDAERQNESLFRLVKEERSGIDFVNHLEETLESNYYQYMYTYIGGGVAAGDINNDGLTDLFFTSNSSRNRLYLNKGNFTFEDISESSQINYRDGFNTGVTMVDINNDGFLDIYVCRGGWNNEENRFANLLYINEGNLTFSERAEEYGLADANRSIQASFFDYDNDNDLDVYISNTPDVTGRAQVLNLDSIYRDPKTLQSLGCDRFYINNGMGRFSDFSEEAGLHYDMGFGLHPQVGDLNNDGWLDIYVCNDFNSPDLAYINKGDGTFSEMSKEMFKHISFNSMGGDIVDLNNDGLPDVLTLDMNPEDYIRSKTTMAMTSVEQFEAMVNSGYHHQYMHNMLHLNNGNGVFSEIGNLAGIGNTDWSWAILSADFDLDGWADIYVTNGVFRDVIDQDKNNEILKILRSNQRKPTAEDFLQFAQMLPQQKLKNYFFKNQHDLTFSNVSEVWAEEDPTFSNGTVYADLDNDGDLDIVVNNINEPATVLQNRASDLNLGTFLQVSFLGPEHNRFGCGAIARVFLAGGSILSRQNINTRGFLSSVPNRLHFGLTKESNIDSLVVCWPDGKRQVIQDLGEGSAIEIDYQDAERIPTNSGESTTPVFKNLASDLYHLDPYFNDFDLQILLPHKLSQTGPALAKADVNMDGNEDVFLGGGTGQPAQILLGTDKGTLQSKAVSAFTADRAFEDQSACFFDANGDGHQDLYVVSGSYEVYGNPALLMDRLYIGDGTGQFSRSPDALPEMFSSGSVVSAADFDLDGDIDLFVGGRVIPGAYPHPPAGFLLENQKGVFADVTTQFASEISRLGMITDATWQDMDDDGDPDLILTGEWLGIEVFINTGEKLERSEEYELLRKSTGWWNRLLVADIDNDEDLDIIAGNLGLNYKFHASKEKPFHVYTSDFDFNGVEDIILAKNYNDREVPVRGKTCMTQQLPHLASAIPTYEEFANADLDGIVGDLETALHYQVNEFRSGIFVNDGSNGFSFVPFENRVQISPINSILYFDFDRDGNKDLLLSGNNHMAEVETTRSDAGIGCFLRCTDQGIFQLVPHLQSGFFADGDARNMVRINTGNKQLIIVANNNSTHDLFVVAEEQSL